MKKLMTIALVALLGFTASTNAFLFWGRGNGNCCGYGAGYGRGCCGNDYGSDYGRGCCGNDGYGYGSGYRYGSGLGWGGYNGGYYGW